jgi:hypothetical protein
MFKKIYDILLSIFWVIVLLVPPLLAVRCLVLISSDQRSNNKKIKTKFIQLAVYGSISIPFIIASFFYPVPVNIFISIPAWALWSLYFLETFDMAMEMKKISQ